VSETPSLQTERRSSLAEVFADLAGKEFFAHARRLLADLSSLGSFEDCFSMEVFNYLACSGKEDRRWRAARAAQFPHGNSPIAHTEAISVCDKKDNNSHEAVCDVGASIAL